MIARRRIRVFLVLLVVCSAFGVGQAWVVRPRTAEPPPAGGVTVVTQQGRDRLGGTSRVIAFRPDGSVLYVDGRYQAYFDVDPVAGTRRTVEYVAVDFVWAPACPDRVSAAGDWCARNLLVRVNLTTGERRVVFERYLPGLHKLHDVDRINDTHLLVANIYRNQVAIVNATTGERTWVWNANESFDYPESGGAPGDWTHLNDVELLPDGRVMVSVRNHDQIVFLDPGQGVVRAGRGADPAGRGVGHAGRGVVHDWTLGCDDCHDVLFEQHNPDYVPAGRGGPAVLVADSENDRVVEYRRTGGEWERTWSWTSSRTAWPRDADRLPNGNTLVTDSHANRVVEVAPNGTVVWSVTLGNPYDAERLSTGDESAGGRPHAPGRQVADGDPVDRLLFAVRDALPSKLFSAVLFVTPYWAGIVESLLLAVGITSLALLVVLELVRFLRCRGLPGLADVRVPLGR